MRYFLTIKCRLNLHTAYKKSNELSNWWGEKCFLWIKSKHTSVKRIIKERKTVFLCFFHIIESQMCWCSADVTYMHLTEAAKPLWSFSSQLNIQSSLINFWLIKNTSGTPDKAFRNSRLMNSSHSPNFEKVWFLWRRFQRRLTVSDWWSLWEIHTFPGRRRIKGATLPPIGRPEQQQETGRVHLFTY